MRAPRFKLAILRWLLRSKPIYDICCALRGPDQFHDSGHPEHHRFGDLKQATTGVVRAKLGMSNKRKGMSALCITNWDGSWNAETRVNVRPAGSTHFLDHQRDAFDALGLAWPHGNTDIKP